MRPQQKRFVKYSYFNDNPPPVPHHRQKEKDYKEYKEKDRTKRNVSYTQKTSLKQNVVKQMAESFTSLTKPTQRIEQICKAFPKYFSKISKGPQRQTQENLNEYLLINIKKPQYQNTRQYPVEKQSSDEPAWSSDSDFQGGLQSKKIDQQLIQKVNKKIQTTVSKKNEQLKRHEKQFLEDYYRQKHIQNLTKQNTQQQKISKNQIKTTKKEENTKKEEKSKKEEKTLNETDNEWTEYQQRKVNQFVDLGIITKLEQDDFQDDLNFQDDQFNAEQQNEKNDSSSEQDDDIFGDEGPTKVVNKKVQLETSVEQNSPQKIKSSIGTVLINDHLFSHIAEQVGIPPASCIWILSNNKQRYKVNTQYMDQTYRNQNHCQMLPYISLNHSQFVHNNEVQTQKGLQKFKKFNARRTQKRYNNNNQNYRNYQAKTKSHQHKK